MTKEQPRHNKPIRAIHERQYDCLQLPRRDREISAPNLNEVPPRVSPDHRSAYTAVYGRVVIEKADDRLQLVVWR
jgi:hypothetical protein